MYRLQWRFEAKQASVYVFGIEMWFLVEMLLTENCLLSYTKADSVTLAVRHSSVLPSPSLPIAITTMKCSCTSTCTSNCEGVHMALTAHVSNSVDTLSPVM